MPRSLRPAAPQTFLHVWNRGVRKTAIFLDDDDRWMFCRLAERRFAAHGIVVHAFCLVGNHYHFMVFDPDGRLSDAMQKLGTAYAQYFNGRYDLSGHVFEGRFESRNVADDADLVNLSRYIHRNALDVHPREPIEAYRWSSYRSYALGGRSPVAVQSGLLLNMIGSRHAYRALVETPRTDDDRAFDYVDADSAEAAIDLDRIDQAVALYLPGCADLTGGARGRPNPARSAAALIAVESSGANRSDLAQHYGFTGRPEFNSAVARARRREANDPTFRTAIQSVRRYLAA